MIFPQENEETLAQRSCTTRPRTQSAGVGLALCQIDWCRIKLTAHEAQPH